MIKYNKNYCEAQEKELEEAFQEKQDQAPSRNGNNIRAGWFANRTVAKYTADLLEHRDIDRYKSILTTNSKKDVRYD